MNQGKTRENDEKGKGMSLLLRTVRRGLAFTRDSTTYGIVSLLAN